jgi:hypothetical protein
VTSEATGKSMPLDAVPVEGGNVLLVTVEDETRARVLGPLERMAVVGPGEALYVSHFSTCPNAAEHRR